MKLMMETEEEEPVEENKKGVLVARFYAVFMIALVHDSFIL